jgi:hypothetical protein
MNRELQTGGMMLSLNRQTQTQQQYRIRNWTEYNAALKQRGSFTFWVSEEVIEQWLETEKTGKKGASRTYSDRAIEVMATLKGLYRCCERV